MMFSGAADCTTTQRLQDSEASVVNFETSGNSRSGKRVRPACCDCVCSCDKCHFLEDVLGVGNIRK